MAKPGKSKEPFLEFSDQGIKAQAELLTSFEKEVRNNGVAGVCKTALELESQGKRNPKLVQSVLGIFLTHNKEARRLGITVPPLALQSSFHFARTVTPAPPPITPDNLKGPGVIAYFREDYDLNDHHKHWHVVFPVPGIDEDKDPRTEDTVKIRRILRQGELFLYMHSQMLARYDAELHAWDMDPVEPFSCYHDKIRLGYTPPPGLLDDYAPRPARKGWYPKNNPDIRDNGIPFICELEDWRSNLTSDMIVGKFRTTNHDGDPMPDYELTEDNMMNTVGFVLEALNPTPVLQEVEPGVTTKREAYGSLHNNGHNKFGELGAYYKNEDDEEPLYGVMSWTAAAVRDPVFWRWHRHIDEFRRVIQRKYSHDLCEFKPNAEIVDLQIVPSCDSNTPPGGLATYLTPPNLRRNEVNAKLRHEPYEWKVRVKSTCASATSPLRFTIRLFIVCKDLVEDLNSWIEMDKFTECLTQEEFTFTRRDVDSAVARKVNPISSASRCSCGWPQNLMLPIGKPDGLDYLAFAMLTNDQLGQVCMCE